MGPVLTQWLKCPRFSKAFVGLLVGRVVSTSRREAISLLVGDLGPLVVELWLPCWWTRLVLGWSRLSARWESGSSQSQGKSLPAGEWAQSADYGTVAVLWLTSICWWVKMAPRLEQASWWTGAGILGLVPSTGGWNRAHGSLAPGI